LSSQNSKDQIRQQHKAAMDLCKGTQGNAQKLCKAEADGQKKISEAQAKVSERDWPKHRQELAEAKAEAQYEANKVKCADEVGDARNACTQSVKADRDKTIAQAKLESQRSPSASSGASGNAGSGSSGTAGGSASMSGSYPASGGATQSPSVPGQGTGQAR
jgi:hypothetical protein